MNEINQSWIYIKIRSLISLTQITRYDALNAEYDEEELTVMKQ